MLVIGTGAQFGQPEEIMMNRVTISSNVVLAGSHGRGADGSVLTDAHTRGDGGHRDQCALDMALQR